MDENIYDLKNKINHSTKHFNSTIATNHEIEQFSLAAIIESSQDAIYSTDFDGWILSWNGAAEHIFGYSASEIVGKNVSQLFMPEDIYKEKNILKRIKSGGQIKSYETVKVRKDGSEVHISLTVSPIRNERNDIIGVSRIARDLTESHRIKERLRESNNLIKTQLTEIETLYRTAPIGLAFLDKNLRYVRVNDRLAEINGVPAEKHLGHTIQEILPEILVGEIEPFSRTVLKTGKPILDLEIKGSNAVEPETIRFCNVNYHPLNNEVGETVGISVVVQEITERKLQEAELKRAIERTEIAQEVSNSTLYEFCSKTDEFIRSESFSKVTGFAPGEIALNSAAWKSLIHPDDSTTAWKEIEKGIAGGAGYSVEYRVRHKDTHYIWVLDRARIAHDSNGEVERVIGVVVDVTERKKAQENLLQSKQRLRGLIDNLFSFVGLLSLDGILLEANRTALNASSISADDVIGRQFQETIWWSWSEDVQEQLSEAIARAAKGETIRYDVVIRLGENQFLPIDFQIAPMFDADGKIINLVPSGIDISERLRLEARLKQTAQISLAGELAAGLAHEIKNPLTGIQGAIDLMIRRCKDGDEDREILENIRREVVRIDDSVHSLLKRARPRALCSVNASLTETMRRTVRLANYQIATRQLKNRIEIVTDFPDESFMMPHDSSQIEDAILNLIINSIEAIGEQCGQIVVRLFSRRNASTGIQGAVVEISDTGCGMSEAEVANLFTPFYTTKDTGTGLGLVAVKRISNAHGGYCVVRSTTGQGSIFTIYLPFNNPGINVMVKYF